jgi:ADP-ribose pyrophosphatase YjhB (NUDIX family)
MKNQECYDKNGKFLGWFSRSVAVVCATYAQDLDNNVYVLASQRGKGTPDPEFVGAWNLVCGYLDFDETCKEAAIRETFEETGVELPKACVREIICIDDPKYDKRQNLSHRFVCILPKTTDNYSFSHKNNEKDEVGAIKWIPIDKIGDYKWAFGHDKIIKEYYKDFVKF